MAGSIRKDVYEIECRSKDFDSVVEVYRYEGHKPSRYHCVLCDVLWEPGWEGPVCPHITYLLIRIEFLSAGLVDVKRPGGEPDGG